MKIIGLSFFILIAVLSCNSKQKLIINDLEKNCLKGKVDSVRLFARKYEKSGKKSVTMVGQDPKRDTTKVSSSEILLSVTKYTKDGFYSEFENLRQDSVIAMMYPGFSHKKILKRINQDTIDPVLYFRNHYHYTGNKLKSITRFNINRDCIRKDIFYFKRKYLIDSAFFMNNGFLARSKFRLSKFLIDTPMWAKKNVKFQFDQKKNVIIDKNIHYYYYEYDKSGNWIKAIKYYDGPNRGFPIYLRREITYFN